MVKSEQKIIPCLWFDNQAEEAVDFYKGVFGKVKVGHIDHYDKASAEVSGQPEGSVLTVEFSIEDYSFLALNGGPAFRVNPSVSFMVNFDPLLFGGPDKKEEAVARLGHVWEKLSEGGHVLMPLDQYPFSERYGWVKDRYGVSWQLILTDPEGEPRPFIIPSLLFVGDVSGKAEEATDFYISVFRNSARGQLARYPGGMEPDNEGTVMFTDFMLENAWFAAMDSALNHEFAFNEAISFMVMVQEQEEVDYYWEKLSAVAEAEQCGWLKDRYGVSWQIVPIRLNELLRDPDKEKAARVMEAMLKMKKLDIAGLEKAAES